LAPPVNLGFDGCGQTAQIRAKPPVAKVLPSSDLDARIVKQQKDHCRGSMGGEMAGNGNNRLEPYMGRLFGFALSLTGNRDLALELVQDCSVKALAARQAPVDQAAFRAWLFRILRNAAIDRLSNGNPTLLCLDDEPETADPASLRVEESLINQLTVRAGMTSLSPAHRDIIALVDIAGFSYSEAAALLEVPVGTVMSRLSRARRALLAAISEHNVHSLVPHRTARRA
jgi:RNA polymerase sigma-70 factor (ECF subfamily)